MQFNASDNVDNDEEKHNVKQYDFRKPKKFTKEHLRDLNNLNENVTRILASNLSGMLRVFSEVNVARVIEKRYSEFISALPDKTLIGLIGIGTDVSHDNEFSMLLHIPSTINFFMIDILLGGSGDGCYFDRGYTEIEMEILKNFYGKIIGYIEEAWAALISIKLTPNSYETNPRLVQVLSPDDSVVEIDYEVKLGESNISTIRLCIPAIALDEFLGISNNQKYSSAKHHNANAQSEKQKANIILSTLSETELELKAVLGTAELDMQEILSLEKGDIIPLSTHIDDNITIEVDSTPWFSAKLGEYKIKKAVKICGNIKKTDNKSYDVKL